jgi:hypothetical protein
MEAKWGGSETNLVTNELINCHFRIWIYILDASEVDEESGASAKEGKLGGAPSHAMQGVNFIFLGELDSLWKLCDVRRHIRIQPLDLRRFVVPSKAHIHVLSLVDWMYVQLRAAGINISAKFQTLVR